MEINLHIERLILDGLPIDPMDGAMVQAAIEGELVRLLAERGLAESLLSGGALRSVPCPDIQVKTSDGPNRLGRQIAGAVRESLGKA